MDAIFLLRSAGLVLWLIAVAVLAPSAWRVIRGSYSCLDEYRLAFFVTGLLFIGGLLRWLFYPDSISILMGIHAFTAALAAYVLLLAKQGRGE